MLKNWDIVIERMSKMNEKLSIAFAAVAGICFIGGIIILNN